MSGKRWVKLYVEINHDAKMLRLSDRLHRRVINCIAFAGELDEDGLLPPVDDMAYLLHADAEQLETELGELVNLGVLDRRDSRWHVTHFAERQARAYGYSQTPEAIRKREQRERAKSSDVSPRPPSEEKKRVREDQKQSRDVRDMSPDMSRDMSQSDEEEGVISNGHPEKLAWLCENWLQYTGSRMPNDKEQAKNDWWRPLHALLSAVEDDPKRALLLMKGARSQIMSTDGRRMWIPGTLAPRIIAAIELNGLGSILSLEMEKND